MCHASSISLRLGAFSRDFGRVLEAVEQDLVSDDLRYMYGTVWIGFVGEVGRYELAVQGEKILGKNKGCRYVIGCSWK